MYNVTITTTGIFNEIRPSLFPLVEGKEGITFMNALEYSTDDILPFEEGDDITDNGPEIELEHERIRAFIIALCAEHGKPYNELRDEFVKALPEFMLDGTYKGEELLSTKRRGSYNVHALYKSERGRDLLFQRNYGDTNGLFFLSDHMVGYLIESLYGRSGIFGMAAGAQRITTPLRCYTIHQAINRIDRYYLPELIAVQALDNTYSMDKSNRSEFLLIADALGAYMVQTMHGQTESEQLDTLSKDPFFRKICEPVHRFYRNLTNDAIISVYDESNDWADSLLHDYIYNLYDRFSEGLDYWEEKNEGVLGYVRYRILSPLADDLVRELSQEKLRVDLYPSFDKARAYFDFLVPYTSHAKNMLIKIGVKEDDDCQNDMTDDGNTCGGLLSRVESLPHEGVQLTVLERIYCLLDACYEAIRRYQNYEALVPIVDTLDATIGEVDIESPNSWQAEYVQRVSRLSKWYRMLGNAFTGNNIYWNLLQDLITAQEQAPLVHEPYFNNYVCDVSCQDNVFNLECLRYLLLHHDIETDNRESYEHRVQAIDHPYFKMPFKAYGQIHDLLDLDTELNSNDIVYFLVLLKAIHRFYLDQLDQNLWKELIQLWSMYGKRQFQDYYAEWLCAKYMVALAVHMGDREQAELIKQNLAITFDEPIHRRNYSSAYQWSPLAFYTMAQIDEALGNLDLAKDNYDKAYVTHAYTQACWAYYKSKCASLWNVNQLSTAETKSAETVTKPIELERKPTTTVMKSTTSEIRTTVTEISLVVAEIKPDFEAVIQENKGKFFTMDEYKEYFNAHMMYLYR